MYSNMRKNLVSEEDEKKGCEFMKSNENEEEREVVEVEPASLKKEKKRPRSRGSMGKKESEKVGNREKNEIAFQPSIHFVHDDPESIETVDHHGMDKEVEDLHQEAKGVETAEMNFDIVPGKNLKNNLKRSSASRRLQMNITSKLQKSIHLTNSCEDESVLLELEKETDILLNNFQQYSKQKLADSISSSIELSDQEESPRTGGSRPNTSCSSTGVSADLSARKSPSNPSLTEKKRQCPKFFSTSALPTHSKRIHCDLMSQWYRANATIGKLIAENRKQSVNAPFIVDLDYNGDTNEKQKSESMSKSDELEILCVRTRLRSRPKQRFSAIFNREIDQQLTTKCRLTDETINLAQKILFEQFPKFVGFEDTNLGVTNGFSKHNEPFIQMLYADAHWIATSALNNVRINVFDSNFSGKLSRSFEKQICQLMRCPLNSLEIMLNSVQTQNNDTDCGLFAIAFAVDICFGTSPVNRPYDVKAMRNHLRSCLIAGKFSLFPTYCSRVSFCKSRLLVQDVFCICRQPFYRAECERDSKLFMAKCSSCMEWYHRGCINIPIKVFKEEKEHDNWTCPG